MNILVIGPSITKSKGGMATVIQSISSSKLINQKYNVEILSSYIDGKFFNKLIYSIISYLKYLRRLNNVDIVHVHMASRGSTWRKYYYVKLAKMKKKKILLHIHGASYREFYENECTYKKQKKIQYLLELSDKVIVLSEEWKEFFTRLCDSKKIKVLHNAVSIPKYEREDYSDNNVLFLGRLGKRKGTYDLLEAIPLVLKEVPDAKFFLGGDGDIEICRDICDNKGLSENVNFLGWICEGEKEKYLKLCSTYILPSYNEGMPMSVLEAMSWGCGVITTPVGGIPQVIEHKRNGLLINPGDIKQISQTLIDVLKNENIKKELGRNAKETVYTKFGIDNWYKELLEIYTR